MSKRVEEQHSGKGQRRSECCNKGACGDPRRPTWIEALQDDVFATADMTAGANTEVKAVNGRDKDPVQNGGLVEMEEGLGGARQRADGVTSGDPSAKDFTASGMLNIDNYIYDGNGTDHVEGSPLTTRSGTVVAGPAGRKAAEGTVQGVEVEVMRLCGGCNIAKARSAFSKQQWLRADGWTRETARQCQNCLRAGGGHNEREDVSGNGVTTAARRQGLRKRTQSTQMTEDTCELRSLEQVLCPSSCRCSNAIPAAAHAKHGEPGGAESKVVVVNGEGVSESMLGVVATGVIEEGEIMTCFGSSATVQDGKEGQELVKIMSQLSEETGGGCQYTCSHNLCGQGFSASKVWVIPPQDIELLLQEPVSPQLREALNRRGPAGVGHFVNHTCCEVHRNAKLAVRWASQARRIAAVVVIATKQIQPGERVLVHYAPEGDDFGQWKRTFKCMCCQCRGVCGGGTASGPSDLLEAMRQAATPDWRRAAGLEGQGAAEVGRRVRVKTQDGSLVGNVMQQHESKVQVRGTLGRARQITSVMVDPRECEVIPDNLVWADLTISTSALRRVEYQQAATNQGDYLEDTVLTGLLRWGLHGDSAEAGLQPCLHRDWISGTFTFKYMHDVWQEVRANQGDNRMDLLAGVLQAVSQPDAQGTASRRAHRKGRWLQMDLNLYNNIMMPINIPQHWLLAWIDVKAKKMHLLDCSREYGKGWRGTIHGLMWIWLLASVRRRNTTTKDATAEPIWSIDLRTVDVNDLSLLPGFTREARERIRQCRRDKTETLSTVKNILGVDNVVKLTNLNIELRWGGAGAALSVEFRTL